MSYKSILNIPEHYQQFRGDTKKIDYTLQEAKEFLQSIDAANKAITTRSVTLLGITITTMVALITYALSGGLSGVPDPLKITAMSLVPVFYFVAGTLAQNIRTAIGPAIGSCPDDLINEKTCQRSCTVDEIKIVQINNMQAKISKARACNTRQSSNLNSSIRVLLVTPVVYLVIFFLVNLVLVL